VSSIGQRAPVHCRRTFRPVLNNWPSPPMVATTRLPPKNCLLTPLLTTRKCGVRRIQKGSTMRKALLVTAALGPLALAPLLSTGAQAGPNLVENGGFEMNTLPPPASLTPSNASGAEIDSNWHYIRRSDRLVYDGLNDLQHPVFWQCGERQKHRRGYSLHDE
jgi:hypothetical protein